MDPISISIELELGSFVIGLAGLLFTVMHHNDQKARRDQRERHFQQSMGQRSNGSDNEDGSDSILEDVLKEAIS